MAIATALVAPLDRRVTNPILTPAGLAALEGMSRSTASSWSRDGLMTTSPNLRRGWPSIPLIGLTEAHVAWRLRRHRLPMEEVRAVLDLIRHSGQSQYATLSQRLVTDGVYAYLRASDGVGRVVDQQLAIEQVVEDFTTQLLVDDDGLVFRYQVDQMPGVVIDPSFNSGRMMFSDSSVPVFAVAGLLASGEPVQAVADEFGISAGAVEIVATADPDWLSAVA